MLKLYYPYISDKKKYKYYIITNQFNKVYFGSSNYKDFTTNGNDEERKKLYLIRHQKNENWTRSGINSAGFWSRWLLWNKPTIEKSYNYIKMNFLY
jgi:hypothetical protein